LQYGSCKTIGTVPESENHAVFIDVQYLSRKEDRRTVNCITENVTTNNTGSGNIM
jgi:hypothetical protein